MAISILIRNRSLTIGDPSLLKAWFSSIYVLLEGKKWGRLYPIIMRELYTGALDAASIEQACVELKQIQAGFKGFSPQDLVWDFEKLDARPPWDNHISDNITSLSNYFVTSSGEDLFQVFEQAFQEAQRSRVGVQIR
jgi:hypothetical protein